MDETRVLTFEEWFARVSSFESNDHAWSVSDELDGIPVETVASYMRNLFTNADTLCADVPPQRLCHMIWFVFGLASGYWGHIFCLEDSEQLQIDTLNSVCVFYSDFLDPFFLLHPTDKSDFGTAVYMIWDMDNIEGSLFRKLPHLVEPAFSVLSTALDCRSYSCQISALHGLGHVQHLHPERTEALIDAALAREDHLHPDLIGYAKDARSGNVL